MCAFDEILRQITFVFPAFLGDWIGDVLLLQQQVARVGDVREDAFDVGIHPAAAVRFLL